MSTSQLPYHTLWMIAYFLRQCGLPTTLTASSGLRTHAKFFKASWTGSSTTLIHIYIRLFTVIDILVQVQHLTYLKIQNLPKGHVHPKEATIAKYMKNFEDGKLTRYDYVAVLTYSNQSYSYVYSCFYIFFFGTQVNHLCVDLWDEIGL